MRVVVTHGRDQAFQIPATMQREWADALRFGLESAGAPNPSGGRGRHHVFGRLSRVEDLGQGLAHWDPDDAGDPGARQVGDVRRGRTRVAGHDRVLEGHSGATAVVAVGAAALLRGVIPGDRRVRDGQVVREIAPEDAATEVTGS